MPYKPFIKLCKQCLKEYKTKKLKSIYCSLKCFGLANRGIQKGTPFKKGHKVPEEWRKRISKSLEGKPTWMKGKKHTQESIRKMRLSDREKQTGKNNVAWRGDQVSYTGLHQWVSRQLGKPKKCEFCGTTTARKFEWANINKEYKRNLTDWVRLCTKCHRNYDYGNLCLI